MSLERARTLVLNKRGKDGKRSKLKGGHWVTTDEGHHLYLAGPRAVDAGTSHSRRMVHGAASDKHLAHQKKSMLSHDRDKLNAKVAKQGKPTESDHRNKARIEKADARTKRGNNRAITGLMREHDGLNERGSPRRAAIAASKREGRAESKPRAKAMGGRGMRAHGRGTPERQARAAQLKAGRASAHGGKHNHDAKLVKSGNGHSIQTTGFQYGDTHTLKHGNKVVASGNYDHVKKRLDSRVATANTVRRNDHKYARASIRSDLKNGFYGTRKEAAGDLASKRRGNNAKLQARTGAKPSVREQAAAHRGKRGMDSVERAQRADRLRAFTISGKRQAVGFRTQPLKPKDKGERRATARGARHADLYRQELGLPSRQSSSKPTTRSAADSARSARRKSR